MFNLQMILVKLKLFLIYFKHDLSLLIELSLIFLLIILWKFIDKSINLLRIFFKLFSNNLFINIENSNLSRNWLLEFTSCNKFMSWSSRMMLQIISWPISKTNTFNPSLTHLYLCIPAIWSIMSHLIFHMLSKSNMILNIYSTFLKESISSN